MLKTGTDLGNTEGSAYGSLLWRNILGGAETLSLNASAGTRTRSAYSAELGTPLLSNPDVRLSVEGLASSTQKPWASHEEVLKGGAAKLTWAGAAPGDRFQLGYSAAWRQVTGLAPHASPTVRADAGDSLKNALSYLFVRDRRDNPMLPQRGYLLRSNTELAGWGPLGGDVGHAKSELEVAGAVPVPIPGLLRGSRPSGVSLGAGFRAGLLYPLPLSSYGLAGARPSRVNDRFTLGGPTDVRGFALGGLGPRDGADAVGGDLFAAGSVNLLLPLPRAGADSPFRLQLFANGGRLAAVKSSSSASSSSRRREKKQDGDGGDNAGQGRGGKFQGAAGVWDGVLAAARDVADGPPSVAAGVGLVYAHPVARLELNFSLPLVVRRGEEARKGLQVGVGINFL